MLPSPMPGSSLIRPRMACARSASAAEARGQAEAEGLSASFRKASRRVLPAVVTVRPIGVPNPFDTAARVAVGPGSGSSPGPPLASRAARAW